MIKLETYMNEIINFDEELKDKLKQLYSYYDVSSNIDINAFELNKLINDLVNKLFNPSGLYAETLLPFSFLQSSIGKVMLSLMSDIENRAYTINDLIIMTKSEERPEGYTYQYLSQEVKAGRLNAHKSGGRLIISHIEVERYLKSKGLINKTNN